MTRYLKKSTRLTRRTPLFIPSLLGVVLLGTLVFNPPDPSQAGSAPVSAYQVLHSFTGNDGHGFNGDTDGANPSAQLIEGPDGYLYGTTVNGSASATGPTGTVFKIDSTGNITILHHFLMVASGDGATPYAKLTPARDGYFYGTTYMAVGGTGGGSNGGTVFKIDANGAFTKVHTFTGAEGGYPRAEVIQAKDGYFYGTATAGGYNRGTVFKMTPSGNATLLYAFTGGADGFQPIGGLVQASDGNFYGTTRAGGTSGLGTVFRITASGGFTVLHSFKGMAGLDGATSVATLIEANDGNFYGTTSGGGLYGFGSVFKMDQAGVVTLVYSFKVTDGADPRSSLIQATDGNFYGTTYAGGTYSFGTIFRLTPSGTLTLLRSFGTQTDLQSTKDGLRPTAGLVQASDGSFYSTTFGGGSQNKGVVFRLSVLAVPVPTPTPVPSPSPGPTPQQSPSPTPGATPVPTPSPSPSPIAGCNSSCGAVEVAGRVTPDRDVEFNVDVRNQTNREKLVGHVNYRDKSSRLNLRSTSVTCLQISGEHATIIGTGEVDGAIVTFQIDLDGSSRRNGSEFSITLSNGYRRSGVIRGGPINLRECRLGH